MGQRVRVNNYRCSAYQASVGWNLHTFFNFVGLSCKCIVRDIELKLFSKASIFSAGHSGPAFVENLFNIFVTKVNCESFRS